MPRGWNYSSESKPPNSKKNWEREREKKTFFRQSSSPLYFRFFSSNIHLLWIDNTTHIVVKPEKIFNNIMMIVLPFFKLHNLWLKCMYLCRFMWACTNVSIMFPFWRSGFLVIFMNSCIKFQGLYGFFWVALPKNMKKIQWLEGHRTYIHTFVQIL